MKVLFLFLFSCMFCFVHAQHQTVTLKLNALNNKKEIPFYIQKVIFANTVSDTIGMIATDKNKGNTYALLDKNKADAITQLIHDQFIQDKKNTPIVLQIKKMHISPTVKGKFNYTDTFYFQGEFMGIVNNEQVPLFTFNASNPFGTFEMADQVLANYISRALTSAILKFKASFENKKEWQQTFKNAENQYQKPIEVRIHYNKSLSTDTIFCNTNKKLTWNDFQELKWPSKNITEENIKSGSAKFILTYKASSEESNKQIKLDIYIYAFFNKKNSWKPSNISNDQWLYYQQGHFDICTYYGTKLTNEMKNYQFSIGSFRAEMNTIFNNVYTEYKTLRKQYETETASGSIDSQNKIWFTKINELNKSNTDLK
jgi:hypothetical protein